MYRKFRQWLSLFGRKQRLTLAAWIIKPLGCTTVSGDLMLQAVKKMAELDSYIEKSGEIRRRTHAYQTLLSRQREIGQMLEGAVRIGDPTTAAQQLIQVYMQARWLSMSNSQRKKIQLAQAAQQIAQKLSAPKATAVSSAAPAA